MPNAQEDPVTVPNPAPQPGASPYGPAGSGPVPTPKKTGKAPVILIVLGGVILAVSVIAGIVITVIGISSAAGGISDIEVLDSGSGTVTAEEGDLLQFYAKAGTPMPSCQVVGPSDGALSDGPNRTSSTTIDGTQWESFDIAEVKESGEFEIDCGGTPVAVGPPVSIGGIFGAVGGVLLGVGGGFVGFVLLAIGVILLIMRRRAARA
ncbi:hypothetical protein BH708_08990 [Brachybacterium sp. P6-10-X1]|nr:hypothetical protein BH708_08990 [Brachybacterium sp. P6-10-X1]